MVNNMLNSEYIENLEKTERRLEITVLDATVKGDTIVRDLSELLLKAIQKSKTNKKYTYDDRTKWEKEHLKELN